MLVATSEGGDQASDEGPPKVGDLVLIKQHGPYKDRTGRVTKVVGAKARVEFEDNECTHVDHGSLKVLGTATPSQSKKAAVPVAPQLPPRGKRTLADLGRAGRVDGLVLRVIDVKSPFANQYVRVLQYHTDGASASVQLHVGGTRVEVVALTALQVVSEVPVASMVARTAASAVRAETFAAGDFVRIVSGVHVGHLGIHRVVEVRLDDLYAVQVAEHGKLVLLGAHLVKATPVYSQRPAGLPLTYPTVTTKGKPWTPAQRGVLDAVLTEFRNVRITGEPGAGKTETSSQLLKTLQSNGVQVMVMTLSNAITAFLRDRHARNGVLDCERIIGTYSSKAWASLGAEYRFDRVDDIVAEILDQPYTKTVRQQMRDVQVIIFEEDENTPVYFKDVMSRVFSKVCGHVGPEPFANKLMVLVMDERQLSGIAVHDGTSNNTTGALRGGGVAVGGGDPIETLSFESQVVQPYYPGQVVLITTEHLGFDGCRKGTVVRYCSLRGSYLVACLGATETGLKGFGEDVLVAVEYVRPQHLLPGSASTASFIALHLTGSHRVAQGAYDDSLPVHEQPAESLWHKAITQLHSGICDTPHVRELFDRLRDYGKRMFDERPEKYHVTQFSFLTNKALEMFVEKEWLARYEPEEQFKALPGSDIVHYHPAIKCDSKGVPLPGSDNCEWDAGSAGGDGGGGRQHVAGAVACRFHWKIGIECVVGTFPQHLQEGGQRAPKIIVGKQTKKYGFLSPGKRIVPVDLAPNYATIAGVQYDGLVVECLDFPYQEEEKSYPTAILPVLMYTSEMIMGSTLHWLQWPIKYRLLSTSHANTGRQFGWMMMTFEFFWCYDALFSTLTRLTHPPGPIGTPLADCKGAAGIRILNTSDDKLFDNEGLPLGLHPKTALLFRDAYGKAVPAARIASAERWLAEHREHHLREEGMKIGRLRARASVSGPSARFADEE